MVYIAAMKTETIEPEILVATDERLSKKGKTGTGGLRLGSAVLQEMQKLVAGANLPATWQVVSTSIDSVVAGKIAAPITFVDVVKFNERHVHSIMLSLARSQQVTPYRGYVIQFEHLPKASTAYEVKLLKLFPEPEKVAITQNRDQTIWALRKLAVLWQVAQTKVKSSRASALDDLEKVVQATQDLRVANGRLSAKLIADLFGFNMREFALLLGRTPQAVAKTPDAESLQDALKYFERMARVRLVLKDEEMFRKWLRMPIPALGDVTPESFLREKKWQALADFVEDILTGAPG